MPPLSPPTAPVFVDAPRPPPRDSCALQGGKSLFRLHGRVVRLRNRGLFEMGLTSAQLRILEIVDRYPGSNLSNVARRLDLTRQAVHRVAHDLVRDDFLELRLDPQDRRGRVASITPVGMIYTAAALEWQDKASTELTSILRLVDLQFAIALLDRLWNRLT